MGCADTINSCATQVTRSLRCRADKATQVGGAPRLPGSRGGLTKAQGDGGRLRLLVLSHLSDQLSQGFAIYAVILVFHAVEILQVGSHLAGRFGYLGHFQVLELPAFQQSLTKFVV